MAEQAGLFDTDERLRALWATADPLERLAKMVEFERFRAELAAALARSDQAKGGHPPFGTVPMFKVLAPHDPVPDAKTIWHYREQRVRLTP